MRKILLVLMSLLLSGLPSIVLADDADAPIHPERLYAMLDSASREERDEADSLIRSGLIRGTIEIEWVHRKYLSARDDDAMERHLRLEKILLAFGEILPQDKEPVKQALRDLYGKDWVAREEAILFLYYTPNARSKLKQALHPDLVPSWGHPKRPSISIRLIGPTEYKVNDRVIFQVELKNNGNSQWVDIRSTLGVVDARIKDLRANDVVTRNSLKYQMSGDGFWTTGQLFQWMEAGEIIVGPKQEIPVIRTGKMHLVAQYYASAWTQIDIFINRGRRGGHQRQARLPILRWTGRVDSDPIQIVVTPRGE